MKERLPHLSSFKLLTTFESLLFDTEFRDLSPEIASVGRPRFYRLRTAVTQLQNRSDFVVAFPIYTSAVDVICQNNTCRLRDRLMTELASPRVCRNRKTLDRHRRIASGQARPSVLAGPSGRPSTAGE